MVAAHQQRFARTAPINDDSESMKTARSRLVLVGLLGVSMRLAGRQEATGNDISVVLDLPSPVLAAEAVQPARMLLSQLPDARTHYFSLAALQPVAEIPNDAVQDLVREATGSDRNRGVFVTAAEAAAIVGRTEQVRDAVIARGCASAADRTSCGPAVHAAALQTLSGLEESTRSRLSAFSRIVSMASPGSVLVLVTAGMPFRNEPRSVLDETVRVLGDRKISLAVIRLQSTVPYTGILRDAVGTLTQRTRTPTVLHQSDAADVPTVVSRLLDLQKKPSASEPRPAAGAPDSGALGKPVQDYVRRFVDSMRFVIAREHYDQQVKVRPTYQTAVGVGFGRVKQQRVMDSEVALVQLSDGIWFMARRVLTVDGKAVSAKQTLGLEVAKSDQEALTAMTALARDSASWNIGGIRRDINSPTIGLWFLAPAVAGRFRFTDAGTEHLASAPETAARVLAFRESAATPVFQVDGVPAPSSGRVWIAPDGSVLKTVLVLQRATDSTNRTGGRATITVEYQYSPKYQVWLPSRMSELYEYPGVSGSEVIAATATYSDYRRFETRARIVR
jgi:hypothetical protein